MVNSSINSSTFPHSQDAQSKVTLLFTIPFLFFSIFDVISRIQAQGCYLTSIGSSSKRLLFTLLCWCKCPAIVLHDYRSPMSKWKWEKMSKWKLVLLFCTYIFFNNATVLVQSVVNVTSFAITIGNPGGATFDMDGNMYICENGAFNGIEKITPDGMQTNFTLFPNNTGCIDVVLGKDLFLYASILYPSQRDCFIYKITLYGNVELFSVIQDPYHQIPTYICRLVADTRSGNLFVGVNWDHLGGNGIYSLYMINNTGFSAFYGFGASWVGGYAVDSVRGYLYATDLGEPGYDKNTVVQTNLLNQPSGSRIYYVYGRSQSEFIGAIALYHYQSSTQLYVAFSNGTISLMITNSSTVRTFLTGMNAVGSLTFDFAGNLYITNSINKTISMVCSTNSNGDNCACLFPSSYCNSICRAPSYFQKHPSHCGSCGNRCIVGKICLSGNCLCASGIFNDNNNCGTCSNVCNTAAGATCQDGVCSCSVGLNKCGSPDSTAICVNFQTNSNVCGKCGNKCMNGQICSNGVCICSSDNSRALNTTTHCGHCSISCTSPFNFCVRNSSSPYNYSCSTSPYEFHSFNAHCYALSLNYGSATEVEEEAISIGGHLISITSEAEQNFTVSQFLSGPSLNYTGTPYTQAVTEGEYGMLWMGLKRNKTIAICNEASSVVDIKVHREDYCWYWISGEIYTSAIYSNWGDSPTPQPDNYLGIDDSTHLNFPAPSYRGKWLDAPNQGISNEAGQINGPYKGVIELHPCTNGGVCSAYDTSSYTCICPKGFVGPTCLSNNCGSIAHRSSSGISIPSYSGGYLQSVSPVDLQLAYSNITICSWIYLDYTNLTHDKRFTIFSYGSDPQQYKLLHFLVRSSLDTTASYQLTLGFFEADVNSYQTFNVRANEWLYLCAAYYYQSTYSFTKLYLNGESISLYQYGAQSLFTYSGSSYVYLGFYQEYIYNYAQGKLDEFRLYNSYHDNKQINRFYTGDFSIQSSIPLLYYAFSEAAGISVSNYGSVAVNATLQFIGNVEWNVNSICECSPGFTYCSNTCVNFSSFTNDANNCGSCGNECINGQKCLNGRCICSNDNSTLLNTIIHCGHCSISCTSPFNFCIPNSSSPYNYSCSVYPYEFHLFNDHCYALSLNYGSATQVEAEAVSIGAHLLSITSPAEQNFINTQFLTGPSPGYTGAPNTQAVSTGDFAILWMGLFRNITVPFCAQPNSIHPEKECWYWTNGDEYSYTNWFANQPDRHQGKQDYGMLNFFQKGYWDDFPIDGGINLPQQTNGPYRGIVKLIGCDGYCHSYANDSLNCGSCGNVCPSPQQLCSGIKCICNTTGGYETCTTAVNPNPCATLISSYENDNSNCGKCGNKCINGQTCLNSACVCPNDTSRALNTTTHCGHCSFSCTPPFNFCIRNSSSPYDYSCSVSAYEFHLFNDHCYALSLTYGSSNEIESESISIGGHLISITSEAEQNFINTQFLTGPSPGFTGTPNSQAVSTGDWAILWMGLFRKLSVSFCSQPNTIHPEKECWYWTNGDEYNFTNWFYREPDRYGGLQDYGMLNFYFVEGIQYKGQWGDVQLPGAEDTSIQGNGPYKGIVKVKFCNGVCQSYANDSLNCGSCGNVCPSPQQLCSGIKCVCNTTGGYETCATADNPNPCATLIASYRNDSNNCGSCANKCNVNGGETCQTGVSGDYIDDSCLPSNNIPYYTEAAIIPNKFCSNSLNDSCIDCPDDSICPGGNIIIPTIGYYSPNPTVPKVFQCDDPTLEKCSGGKPNSPSACFDAYTGTMCSKCSENYYELNSICLPCAGGELETSILSVFIFGYFAFLGVSLIYCSDKWLEYVTIFVVTTQQILAAGDGMFIRFSPKMRLAFNYLRPFKLDFAFLRTDCSGNNSLVSYTTRFGISIVVLLALCVWFSLFALIYQYKRQKLYINRTRIFTGKAIVWIPWEWLKNPARPRLVRSFIFLIVITHLQFTSLCLTMINCTEYPIYQYNPDNTGTETFRMKYEISTICYTGAHLPAAVFSWIFIFTFSIMLPIYFLIKLWHGYRNKLLEAKEFRKRYGFMYRRMKNNRFWFRSMNWIFSFISALQASVLPKDAYVQIPILLSIATIEAILIMKIQPMLTRKEHIQPLFIISCKYVGCGLLFLSINQNVPGYLLTLGGAGSCIYLLYLYRKWKKRDMQLELKNQAVNTGIIPGKLSSKYNLNVRNTDEEEDEDDDRHPDQEDNNQVNHNTDINHSINNKNNSTPFTNEIQLLPILENKGENKSISNNYSSNITPPTPPKPPIKPPLLPVHDINQGTNNNLFNNNNSVSINQSTTSGINFYYNNASISSNTAKSMAPMPPSKPQLSTIGETNKVYTHNNNTNSNHFNSVSINQPSTSGVNFYYNNNSISENNYNFKPMPTSSNYNTSTSRSAAKF